jgi:hypothetical protein
MATRSTISLIYKNGTAKQVYAHWDGYPSNNGELLKNNYNFTQANRLMVNGDISSLDESVEDTTFYGRDHGETDVDAREFISVSDWNKNRQKEEWAYVFVESMNAWYVCDEDDNMFYLLTKEIIKNNSVTNEEAEPLTEEFLDMFLLSTQILNEPEVEPAEKKLMEVAEMLFKEKNIDPTCLMNDADAYYVEGVKDFISMLKK